MKGHFGGRRNLYYERTFHYEKFFRKRELYSEKNIRENNILHKKGEKKG